MTILNIPTSPIVIELLKRLNINNPGILFNIYSYLIEKAMENVYNIDPDSEFHDYEHDDKIYEYLSISSGAHNARIIMEYTSLLDAIIYDLSGAIFEAAISSPYVAGATEQYITITEYKEN